MFSRLHSRTHNPRSPLSLNPVAPSSPWKSLLPTFDPVVRRNPSSLVHAEPCRLFRISPGPIILMLHRSRIGSTSQRSPGSPGVPSARFSTVYPRDPCLHVCLSVLTSFVRSMLGMLIVLFFKCMIALLNPVHRRSDRTKWGLVSYTLVTFSLATVFTAMNLHIQSISFIDNRNSPGGPHGYLQLRYYNAINVVPNTAFCVNNWFADGLLVSFLFGAVFTCMGPNACSSSSIVVTCSTPATSGSSRFLASCTSVLWVRI